MNGSHRHHYPSPGGGRGAHQHQHQHGAEDHEGARGVRFASSSPDGGGATTAPPPGSPLDFVLGIGTACIALGCLAGLLTVLVVLFVTVRPFSLATYRRLSCAWGLAPFLDAVSLLLPGTRICWTGDSDAPSPLGSAVLVANHVVAADWWALFLLGRCVGLPGTLKVFLRNEYLHLNMQDVVAVSSVASASGEAGGGGASGNLRSNGTNGSNLSLSTMNTSSAGASKASPTTGINGHANVGVNASTTSSRRQQQQQQQQQQQYRAAPDLALMAKLLHLFLEFPLINGESSDREQLSALLRSFADTADAGGPPVHLLFYPEGWCNHNGADRRSILAKSNEFAKREGKPVLRHLLLPRTRGFHSSLECLREGRPVIYDVTIAYRGYDGSLPAAVDDLSMPTLWDLLRRRFPREVHLRIKRYSMEEVLQDSNWLLKRWSEKDRLLEHFARHQQFPVGGYGRHRVFDTRTHSLETSVAALVKLLLLPCCVPLLLMISFPLFWTLLVIWCGQRAFRFVFADHDESTAQSDGDSRGGNRSEPQTPGSASLSTPYLPATPFASPSVTNWRDMIAPPKNGGGGEHAGKG